MDVYDFWVEYRSGIASQVGFANGLKELPKDFGSVAQHVQVSKLVIAASRPSWSVHSLLTRRVNPRESPKL
jgi:hypothetical protein